MPKAAFGGNVVHEATSQSRGATSLSPVMGSDARVTQGKKAKGTIKVPKSSKKKVIVKALLGMMNQGHIGKMQAGRS